VRALAPDLLAGNPILQADLIRPSHLRQATPEGSRRRDMSAPRPMWVEKASVWTSAAVRSIH